MTATDTEPTGATEAESTETAAEPTALETLQHTMIERLMGIIGAPDDPDVARAGDEIVRELDAALATAGAA